MRIAVISDIHGNCFALDAALADLRERDIEQVVCLGDAIQGGAQPAETVQRLRELGCPVVMGNADAWLLAEENDTAEPTTPQQRDVRTWTLSQLSAADQRFIRGFEPTIEIALEDGQRLLCFHGSPASYNDILLPDTPHDEWLRLLEPFAPAIMTGGHTHTQQMRRIGEGLFFNPGSVGVAYDIFVSRSQTHTDAWAEYAILTWASGRLSLEFHRVPYDVERLIQLIQSSGRPHADAMIAGFRRTGRHPA
jgi:predicted phosphodiesterase